MGTTWGESSAWANPFKRRGINFRSRPSNAMGNYSGSSLPPGFQVPSGPIDFQDVGPGQIGGVGTAAFNSNQRGTIFDGGGIYAPMPSYAMPSYQGRATERLQGYEDFARSYIGQLGNTENFMPDPRDEEALNAEFAIRAKEAELQQALIDGDLAEAQRLQAEIAANKQVLSNAVPFTNASAINEMDKAMLFAREINERNAPKTSINTAQAMMDELAAYGKGEATTTETANKIGAGDRALAAALEIAGADKDLFLSREGNRAGHMQKMIQFAEDVGVTGVDAIRKTFERQSMDDVAMDKQHWADEDRKIADIFKGLETKQAQLDLGKQRDALQKDAARRGLYGEVEFEARNPIEVGKGAAIDYITDAMSDAPIHRVGYLHASLNDLFTNQAFQAMGDFTAAGVTKFLGGRVELEDGTYTTRAAQAGLTTGEIKILADAIGVYNTTAEQYQFTARNTTDGPKGSETYSGSTFSNWTGSGRQAPNNKAFADEARRGEGSYGARAEFVAQIGPQIAEAYNLSKPQQWRDLDMQPKGGSSNSDHYSGGAIDLFGTMGDMQAAAADLVNRPYVAGVRIHEPGPHLHVSFNIDYFS